MSHNISEASETDEQTPMLPKRSVGGGAMVVPSSSYMLKSDQNCGPPRGRPGGLSLPPPTGGDLATTLPSRHNFRQNNAALSSVYSGSTNGGAAAAPAAANGMMDQDDNQVCELEDSDCETPVNETKPGLPSTPRVTRV